MPLASPELGGAMDEHEAMDPSGNELAVFGDVSRRPAHVGGGDGTMVNASGMATTTASARRTSSPFSSALRATRNKRSVWRSTLAVASSRMRMGGSVTKAAAPRREAGGTGVAVVTTAVARLSAGR